MANKGPTDVIGSGPIGRGIAQVFAQAAYPVFVYDAIPARQTP